MIHVDIDRRAIRPGDKRKLRATGRSRTLEVALLCFVTRPKPGGYRACPECTVQTLQSGEEITITAPPTFSHLGEKLIVRIRDGDDEVEISLDVEQDGHGHAFPSPATR